MSAPGPPQPNPPSSDFLLPAESPSAGRRRGHSRTSEPLRFLQASDFRLDTPCHGVLDLPAKLRDRFVDARYIAAARVFDAAITHDVDFLVLPGGLLDARLPGLRGPWFLTEQFTRLADHGIEVYWAGSTFETRGRWPAHAAIPANVHCLTADASVVAHHRQGRQVASLLTLPAHEIATYEAIDQTGFTIAVQPRTASVPERWNAGIDFWALGGQPHHETEQVGEVIAHFAGSPQGRSPAESGQHSCSLIHVEADGGVRMEPIATNVVRWHHEHLTVSPSTSWQDLEQQLQARQAETPADQAVELAMIHWTVTGSGAAVQRLLEPASLAEMIDSLKANGTSQLPACWTNEIEVVIDTPQRGHSQGCKTTLEAFLRELQGLAGDVGELVRDPLTVPSQGGIGNAESGEQIIQRVRNEGVHRLATDGETATTPMG